MKTIAFILSGLLALWVSPAMMVATVMMLASDRVTKSDEHRVVVLLGFELLVPLIWLIACVLCILEYRRKNRIHFTRAYTLAPYVTAAVSGTAIYVLFP